MVYVILSTVSPEADSFEAVLPPGLEKHSLPREIYLQLHTAAAFIL